MNERQTPLANREAQKVYTADDVHSAITNGKLVNYYQARVDTSSGNRSQRCRAKGVGVDLCWPIKIVRS